MSETTNLSALAQFVGQSPLATPDRAKERRRLAAIAGRIEQKPMHRTVGELLGVVLTLSARSRRAALPRATIEIDVFSPGGKRAVRLTVGQG